MGSAGEASGISLASALLQKFSEFNDNEKLNFFLHLATDLDIDAPAVRTALDHYISSPSKTSYREFTTAVEPGRQELIRRLNRAPDATAKLVRMRADLLRLARGKPILDALDLDFRHLFASWFNRGFLVLRPVNWRSSAHILDKIIEYEAVHAIDSWDDLRLRLKPSDRRCFAFFHPSMPDEPLIFVEVALTRGVPTSIQKLLKEDRKVIPAEDADTAVFYSISNCQKGLTGISFGNFLIKQVVSDLSQELKALDTFVTLSPIPQLSRWSEKMGVSITTYDERQVVDVAAHYLLNAKSVDDLPFDAVARFHLGNGAEILAVHGGADTSKKGLGQSAGVMVNYIYKPQNVAQNHEQFTNSKTVFASKAVTTMAQSGTLIIEGL